jgi:chemotaxis protein MotA
LVCGSGPDNSHYQGLAVQQGRVHRVVQVFYAVAKMVRQEVVIALDTHISNPGESELFQAHPRIDKGHHVRDFICNTLSLVVNDKADTA